MSVLRAVNTGCHNYFSPQKNIDRGQSLRAGAKIASYFLIFPPIIMGAFLGGTSICLSLVGRVKKGGVEAPQGDAVDWDALLKKAKSLPRLLNLTQKLKKADEILKEHPISGFSANNADQVANIAAFKDSIKRTGYEWFFHPELWPNPQSLHSDMAQAIGALHEADRLCTLKEINDALNLPHGPCLAEHMRVLEPLIRAKHKALDLNNQVDMHANQTLDQRIGEFIRVYEGQKAKEHLEEAGQVATDEAIVAYKLTNDFVNRYMVAELVRDWCQTKGYLGVGTTPCMEDGEPLVLTVDNVMPRLRSSIVAIYDV